MKRIIPAIFIAVAALLVFFLLARRLFVQDKTMQRARVVMPIVEDESDTTKTAETYGDTYIETSFITLAQDETLLSTVTMDIDGDGYDDQVNVIKASRSRYILLVIGLYNPDTGKYERASTITTVIEQARTFACAGLDVIGNHHAALVYQGISSDGHSVLHMYMGSRSRKGVFQIDSIGDFTTEGTIFIQQLDRDESYELSLAKGVSFPVWVYNSETIADSSRTDQIQTEYQWNEKEKKYVQTNQIRVPGSTIAAAELARIQDGTVETFSRFLDGLWYKVENNARGIRYLFFDSTAHEIIFEYGDSEEVFSWLNSNLRRGGIYFTAVNTSIENLQRRFDISLVALDEIRIRLQDDVRMLINESTQWDGDYKKLTTRFGAAPVAIKNADVVADVTQSRWKTNGDTEIVFADGTYQVFGPKVADSGRFMVLTISGESIMQFRSDTRAPFFKETYAVAYQSDKDTVAFLPVVVSPDRFYASEEKPLVLNRIAVK